MAILFNTLVITSGTKWEEPPRIRHQVAREMKKYFRKVLFVETPRYLRYNFENSVPVGIRQVEDNIFALRLPRSFVLPKNGHALIPFLSESLQKCHLKIIQDSLVCTGAENPILVNFTYSDHVFHNPAIFKFSIFLLHDDFINKAPNLLVHHLAKRMQDKTAKKADLCLAVSTPLLEQVKNVNPNSHLFLPGHGFGEAAIYGAPFLPRGKGQKIKAVFMGYIDGRLDAEWIKHASSDNRINFYLVGPNSLDGKTTKSLRDHGVHFIQALQGKELFDFLSSCDVMTMPYILNEITIGATAPNKLFQYIATGRPIVSSNMPNLLALPDYVLKKAESKEDFIAKIIEAFEKDSEESTRKRTQIASENTWEKRGRELVSLIEKGIREKYGQVCK